MTQEDTALQAAWKEWLAAHPDRSTAGPVYRPGFEAGWGARQQVIDSLTAERDNAVWRADRLDEAGRVQQARAEAAEAEVKRLREAGQGASEAFWGMFVVIRLPSSFLAKMRALDAALATPPSEGD